ncbi:MAG: asparaginase [Anaerolineae bacterium]|nr:asparaginase [Anaerolineae bacterium]
MGVVKIVTTGGTIAMKEKKGAGALPALTAEDLKSLLPPDIGPLETEEFCNLPSAHMTTDFIFKLSQRVKEIMAADEVIGVVITHGTNVMEETAYLLDLVVDTEKPIVLTGAMRNASQVGYDGIANLKASIRVATSSEARDLGALVVMNDEIHAARYVTKTHTQALNTFQSPSWGPLGRVDGDRVVIGKRVKREHIPCQRLAADVPLMKLAVGLDERFLSQAIERRADGAVIEALGGGRVPPWWMPSIKEAINRGLVVVIASRCPAGRLYDEYGFVGGYRDLKRVGVIFSEGLSGQKARIKLMAALGVTRDKETIQRFFLQE